MRTIPLVRVIGAALSALLIALWIRSPIAAAQTADPLSFGVALAPWEMVFDAGGMTVTEKRLRPDGGAGYLAFRTPSGLNVSAFIEPVTKCADARACRDMVWKLGNPSWGRPQDVKMFECGEASCFEFLVPTFQGINVQQQNLYAQFVKAGYWVDLHVSLSGYTPDRHGLFDSLMRSIRFQAKTPTASAPLPPAGAPGFEVPGHGRLVLKTPASWRVQSRSTPQPSSVNVVFTPPSGNAFHLQITAVWMDDAKRASALASLRERTTAMAQEPLRNAVEKSVILREIRGPGTQGFAYSLTDKAAPADEYRYLTQSMSITGELLVMTTFLTHGMPSGDLEEALKALASATHVK